MCSLLIIGGSGFFGKSLLEAFKLGLLDNFSIDSVTILSRNAEYLSTKAPELVTSKIKLINADISTCIKLPVADIVIHAAANSSEANYISGLDFEKENIINGVKNFCEVARRDLQNSKILYVSSGAIYGEQPTYLDNISEEDGMHTLHNFTESKRVYAEAKRNAEKQISSLGLDGFDVSIARCFSFVGKYLPLNTHFAIGNFIGDAKLDKEIIVKAKHNVYRSYMHTYDLSCWLLTIALAGSPRSPTYNVGSDISISIHELAILISKMFNVKAGLPKIESKVIDKYVPSIEKAKSELNLRINYSLPEAIKLTYDSI
jgi:nucleoside-diphosphate-sugar epimerase